MRDQELRQRAGQSVETKLAAGMSGSRISMQQSRECFVATGTSLMLAWRNLRLALRTFFFGVLCWIMGGCSEAAPVGCQFYLGEIERVEKCVRNGDCEAPVEQEIAYQKHMERELGYCRQRAKVAEGNAP